MKSCVFADCARQGGGEGGTVERAMRGAAQLLKHELVSVCADCAGQGDGECSTVEGAMGGATQPEAGAGQPAARAGPGQSPTTGVRPVPPPGTPCDAYGSLVEPSRVQALR